MPTKCIKSLTSYFLHSTSSSDRSCEDCSGKHTDKQRFAREAVHESNNTSENGATDTYTDAKTTKVSSLTTAVYESNNTNENDVYTDAKTTKVSSLTTAVYESNNINENDVYTDAKTTKVSSLTTAVYESNNTNENDVYTDAKTTKVSSLTTAVYESNNTNENDVYTDAKTTKVSSLTTAVYESNNTNENGVYTDAKTTKVSSLTTAVYESNNTNGNDVHTDAKTTKVSSLTTAVYESNNTNENDVHTDAKTTEFSSSSTNRKTDLLTLVSSVPVTDTTSDGAVAENIKPNKSQNPTSTLKFDNDFAKTPNTSENLHSTELVHVHVYPIDKTPDETSKTTSSKMYTDRIFVKNETSGTDTNTDSTPNENSVLDGNTDIDTTSKFSSLVQTTESSSVLDSASVTNGLNDDQLVGTETSLNIFRNKMETLADPPENIEGDTMPVPVYTLDNNTLTGSALTLIATNPEISSTEAFNGLTTSTSSLVSTSVKVDATDFVASTARALKSVATTTSSKAKTTSKSKSSTSEAEKLKTTHSGTVPVTEGTTSPANRTVVTKATLTPTKIASSGKSSSEETGLLFMFLFIQPKKSVFGSIDPELLKNLELYCYCPRDYR